ncbi:MAG: HAMP domain-containing histidine kinase [Clostridium sp.]|nr:HAMP domain-containing histidine kinase [Clostridium sp.]
MASWRRFSYQWRLFMPLLLIVWLIIGLLAVFQYRREIRENQENIDDELSLVLNRVLRSYENRESPVEFLDFIYKYYDSSPNFKAIRLSVYENNGMLRYVKGRPIPFDFYGELEKVDIYREPGENNDTPYFYKSCASSDGRYFVMLGLQSTRHMSDTFVRNPMMWVIIIALGVIASVLVYLVSRYVARTITLMRDFADEVASGRPFDSESTFPHDELGDIARHIVQLYKDKDRAQRKTEKEHEIAIHAVREKMRIKHQLTNNINHELKTPVGAIKGYLDTIVDTPDLPDQLRDKFLRSARQNVDRLVNLLNDVSAMTRLEEGGATIPLSDVDFHDIIFSIESDLGVTKLAGSMKFSYDIPIDCLVVGNANLLNGMISNLIRNAAQHSGGTEIRLRMVSENDKYYTFSFADNGKGVPQEHLTRLFERFYRVDTGRSRKVGGTGLGLPIVRNTIEAMGGSISVHNLSTGGLDFIFTLRKWDPDDLPALSDNPDTEG